MLFTLSFNFIYRTLCTDIYISILKYLNAVYILCILHTLIATLKCISLQYIYICLVFLMYLFTGEYSVHFYPFIKNLIL